VFAAAAPSLQAVMRSLYFPGYVAMSPQQKTPVTFVFMMGSTLIWLPSSSSPHWRTIFVSMR
jgi:hypothetical protein